MRIFSTIVLMVLLVTQIACTSKTYEEPYTLFDEVTELRGEQILVEDLQYNTPFDMVLIDSSLFIMDQYSVEDTTHFFSVVDVHDNELIKYFGKEGRGPDEFLFPSELSRVSGNPNVIGINNRRIFSFSELSIENLLTSNSNYTISTTSQLNNGYSRIIKAGDTAFFGTGVFPNGRFGLSDSGGNFLFSTTDYPFQESFESIDTKSLGMGYQSNLTSHPDEKIVAVATIESANIDIISISKDSIEVIKSIHQYPPLIDDNSSAGLLSVQYLPENRRGYEFLTSTSNYIYALYSGTKRSEGTTKYSAGEVVFKYDWSGNAIRQYTLDRPVKLIAIDKQDEIMYAMSSDSLGQSSLYRYNLR